MLLEVVLGPLWVWLALSERPSAATLAGGGVVVVAVGLQAGGDAPAEPDARVGVPCRARRQRLRSPAMTRARRTWAWRRCERGGSVR